MFVENKKAKERGAVVGGKKVAFTKTGLFTIFIDKEMNDGIFQLFVSFLFILFVFILF
jgi:hypothetical protein